MNKIVTSLVAVLLFFATVTYAQVSLTLSPAQVDGNTGETVTVSVIANNFTDIVSMQYGIDWDPAVLQFTGVDNFNSNLNGLGSGNFNGDNQAGFLTVAWFEPNTNAVSAPAGSSLFDISFEVVGDANAGTFIEFASRPGLAIEFINDAAEDVSDSAVLTNNQFGEPEEEPVGNTSPLILSASTNSGEQGVTVCVNINASNFQDITQMQYSLGWDETVLDFNRVQNFNLTGLDAADFNTSSTASGQLGVNWSDANGVSLSNGTRLYQVCFDLIGAAGASSSISFTNTPEPVSITTTASASSVGITPTSGTVSINNPAPPPSGGSDLLNITSDNAPAGATVCIPITVNNFNDIVSMQYSLSWNPAVLQFSETNYNGALGDSNPDFRVDQVSNGQLGFLWFDESVQGISIADGTTIFEVCFDVVGSLNNSTNITFGNSPIPIEITNADEQVVDFTPSSDNEGTFVVSEGGMEPPAEDGIVNIPNTSAQQGETICIPVTVNDFDGIAAMQFSVGWNTAILQFSELSNFGLSGLDEADFTLGQTNNGRLGIAWDDPNAIGVSLADGSTIFEMCFEVLGSTGQTSSISFSGNPIEIEIATANEVIPFSSSNGSFTVQQGGVEPPAEDGIVNIPDISAQQGETICIPITVANFDTVAAMQFSVEWNPAILQFSELSNFGLPGLDESRFTLGQTNNGRLGVAWDDANAIGVTLADGSTIFEMCFVVTGSTGQTSSISFSDNPISIEIANANEVIPFSSSNGTFTVQQGGVEPPAEDGIVNIPDTSAQQGETICIPVTVANFDTVAAMQFSVEWNPAILQFSELSNFGLPGLDESRFTLGQTNNGRLGVAWDDANAIGVTLADGSTIFEICFVVTGSTGQTSSISFSDNPISIEIANANEVIPFSSSNGTFTVQQGGIEPPAEDGILNIPDTSAQQGETICIPVTVQGFNDIAAMQFSVEWNPAVLQFSELSNFGLPGLSEAQFTLVEVASGKLAVSWPDPNAIGVSLSNGSTIFEMCFEVVGSNGQNTTISFTDDPTARELATDTEVIPFTSTNGTFTVGTAPPVEDVNFNLASPTVTPGEDFCVPITVAGFTNITNTGFSMAWDPSVVSFSMLNNLNLTGLAIADFNLDNTNNGQLSVNWTDNNGVTLADNTVIFEICFTASQEEGSTLITFTDNPVTRQVTNTAGALAFAGANGVVNVQMSNNCAGPVTALATAPTNVSCFGGSDGALNITQVTGGDGTYTYTWSDPTIGNTPNPTGLSAGVYSVTISSCGGTETFSNLPIASLTVTEPDAILTVATPNDASCFGVADGSITVSASGGTLPYNYTWSDTTFGNTNNPMSVPAGSYSLTITDGNNCISTTSNIVVDSPSPIEVAATTINASCSGAMDGAAALVASGGSGSGYTFDWPIEGVEGANPTTVPSGAHAVTVTDSDNCMQEITVTIGADLELTADVQVVEDACGDGQGAIQITPTAGTAPFSFDWDGPATIGNTGTAENLPTGIYSVTYTDAEGCFNTIDNIEVGGPVAILAASASINDVDCEGDQTGGIMLTATGGFSPYTFLWDDGDTTNTRANLSAGSYTVTITDSKLCTYTDTYTVQQRSNLAVSVTVTKGAPDGAATANVTGGVTPYEFLWCNGQMTPSATELAEGECSVTVTDDLGCSVIETFNVEIDSPEVEILLANEIACNGESQGIIQAEIISGQPPYNYLWNTGANSSLLINIPAGTYTVTVTDGNGKTGTASYTLTEPDPISINTNELSGECLGGDGAIEIAITGGTMPVKSVVWSNDIMDQLRLDGLQVGEYAVIVTDENDCIANQNFRITFDADPTCRPCYAGNKAITPNEDGRNDAFRISCVDLVENHLEIYNRWGQLVYEADNYQCVFGTEGDCWKGFDRSGNAVDEGGYFWILDYTENGQARRVRDHVTVVREN